MAADSPRETDDAAAFRESLTSAIRDLRESASVERVYGDPIEVDGRTVVPVARVAYGFGGGFGSAVAAENGGGDSDSGQRGAGGGGGAMARPLGALEITDRGTRFVRFTDWKRLALAVGAGVVLGALLGRR